MTSLQRRISKVPSALFKVLRSSKSFVLLGHVRPDADTLGSGLALASLIKRVNASARVTIANAMAVPPGLRFFPRWKSVTAPVKEGELKGFETVVFLECGSPERAGSLIDIRQCKYSVNIDHHKTARRFAKINFIDEGASSNAEQIYLLFRTLRLPIKKEEAFWLYAGIVSDTGRFQYSLTTPDTHLIAADLMTSRIAHTEITEALFQRKSVEQLKLLELALKSLKFHKEGRVASMALKAQDFASINNLEGQTEDIVNYGLTVPTVTASFLMKEEPSRGLGVISVSLRSRDHIDVSRIAGEFGGGGHFHASGCEIEGSSLEKVQGLVLNEIEKQLE